MAVGETSGQARPRRVISAGGGRRRPTAEPAPAGEPGRPPSATGAEAPRSRRRCVKEADPELERLLAEEEEIERRTREHHETPHFRGEE